jgi:DNA-binding MarR family transcriptional regulator
VVDVPGDELTRLVDAVIGLSGAFWAEGDRLTAPLGLTGAQWTVLGALQDGPLSVAAIARRRGLRRQSVRETVARLEQSGFVERRADPEDARAPLVTMTRQGRQALRRIEPSRARWAADVESRHDPAEVRRAVELLNRLRAEFSAGST